MEEDKINAYMTLYTALVTLVKAAAPMIPFMSEEIYQNLVRSVKKDAPESVHLCSYPKVNEEFIDKDLEDKMGETLKIVVLGRAARNDAKIKNRQPLEKMYIKSKVVLSEYYTKILLDELNVKSVEFKNDLTAFTTYEFKPNLPTVGPKYGKFLGKIRAALQNIDGNKAYSELKENGSLTLSEVDNAVVLSEDDLLINISQKENYQAKADKNITVVLYTKISEELLKEGIVREIISKIQTMRKEADFLVMDRINVGVKCSDRINAVIKEESCLLYTSPSPRD